jgi:hypothetical protein
MSIHEHKFTLSTCVGTQSPKYLEMAQGHVSLSELTNESSWADSLARLLNEPSQLVTLTSQLEALVSVRSIGDDGWGKVL